MNNWFSQLTPGDWALFIGLLANAIATVLGLRRSNPKVDVVQIADSGKAAQLYLDAQTVTANQNIETQDKLNQIHTLVNSNLTREMEERLVALKGQVHLTKELIRLNRQNNLEPDMETQNSLSNLEAIVVTLETALRERGSATAKSESKP